MSETNNFKILQETKEEVVFFYLSGYLDAHTAPELEEAISGQIETKNYKIVINLKDLDYISSAGLGVFMAFIEDIRDEGGDIKIAELKPKVFSVFDLLGFPMLFDIFDDEKSATEKFKKDELKKDA